MQTSLTPQRKTVITRTINRFREACESKAFQGTIPAGESYAAAMAYQAVDDELEAAEIALRRLLEKNA